MEFHCYMRFTLPKQSKDLDLSFKRDLDFLDCFGRKKKLHLITEEIWYCLYVFLALAVPILMSSVSY